MAPPAKRRKRNLVTSGDEDEPKPKTNTLANYLFSSPDRPADSGASKPASASPSPVARKAPRPPPSAASSFRNNGTSRSGSKSASVSPQKPRTRAARSKPEEKGRTADLKTLFSKQAERAPPVTPTILDDILSDPISDDEGVQLQHRAATASHVGANARKRFKDAAPPPSSASSALSASQRFLRPPRPPRDPALDDDQRPWAERFGPANLDELAVHKRKVADVRKWLEDVMAGRMRQRLLILKGAAGTGKTTTLRLLAKDMRCELLEWRNPTSTGGLGFQSASAQFDEFMGRGGKFNQLDIEQEATASASRSVAKASDNRQKMIMIEEFPNTFTRSSTALQSFRSSIMSYLAANTPSLAAFGQPSSDEPITPVVMVISETLLTTTSASADSFTAHRLLGPEITRHPGTAIIEFNAIAPTLLSAALEVVLQKEARKSGRKRSPGPLVLRRLGEIGDIRSAVSSLEFLCLKGDTDTDWGSKINFAKPKRSLKNNVALTKTEEQSLEFISQREASLGIFHAVGKVVYNKRAEAYLSDQTTEGKAEKLPGFVAHHSRPKRSEVNVDSLIDEIGTDTHTFISALHENYPLSCAPTGPDDLSSSVDYTNECIEYLSLSDLLCPSSDIFFGGRGSGRGFIGRDSASQVLRQDEIAFQVATRGLLFSLPNPVKRIGTTSHRGGGDAFKMFYPTSLKLWRDKEELESVVDLWSTRLLKGEEETGMQNLTDGASIFRKPKSNDSGSWINKQQAASQKFGNQQRKDPASEDTHAAPPLLSLGSSARREMLLERLPYMTHMARRRRNGGPQSGNNLGLRELEKVVSFSGVAITAAGEDEADEAVADGDDAQGGGADAAANGAEEWATDRPTEDSFGSPQKGRGGGAFGNGGARRRGAGGARLGIHHKNSNDEMAGSALPAVQTLVISDDDIEDDWD
jgi:cell cycle checkpoint protein